MSIERGLCTVDQVALLTKPVSNYGDFKYHTDTKPSITEVEGWIDFAYDKLALLFDTYGIVTPVVEEKTRRYCAIINAYKTAIDIETGIHSNAPPKSTTKSQKLQMEYDALLKSLKEELRLPTEAINGNRLIIDIHDGMWSNIADLFDTSKYDDKSKESFIKIDKKF